MRPGCEKCPPAVERPDLAAPPGGSEASEFSSFLFWRNPLPSIEEDLQALLVRGPKGCSYSIVSSPGVSRSPGRVALWLLRQLVGLLSQNADAVVTEEEGDPKGQESEEEEEESDEEGGWITPSNIKQIQQDLGQRDEAAGVKVGCLTTDFAMQASGGGLRVLSWPLGF